jgi:Spy/CpxP family protein refolding chaperone
MKKILSLALILCGVSGLIAVAVHAANPPSTPAAAPAVAKPAERIAGRGADRLGLTAEQQAKLASLREQMKAVLTPEQQQRMAQARARFQGARGPGGPENFRRGQGFDRHGPQRFGHHRGGPQMRHHAARGQLQKMKHVRERRAALLGLTDEQRAKMRQIAFQNREKAIGLRQDLRKEMESVLTPEQKAKVQELRAGHGRRGPGRHHGGERSGPPRAN